MDPSEGIPRRLLVTGCPRSGTRYLREILNRVGIEVEHEKMGPHGTVSSYFAVDDWWYHGSHHRAGERRRDYIFEQTWHLWRDPQATIGSLAARPPQTLWWVWQERHTGVSGDLSEIARAAAFWWRWQELCLAQADWVLRLEALEGSWPEMMRRLGHDSAYPQDVPRIGESHAEPVQWQGLAEAGELESVLSTTRRLQRATHRSRTS